MSRRQGEGTPALLALRAAGVRFTVHAYEHRATEVHFGREAAEALGVDPRRVFKTLVADLTGQLAVAVVPVAAQLDLKALAVALGAKRAVMADPKAAARATGYVLGGISPLGQRSRLPTVIDDSALTQESILVSAGRRGLQVELAPADLCRLTAASVHPIAH
jgi:Cys-tRNA(Pro)/Cys-tRNA(Cys) deacylase